MSLRMRVAHLERTQSQASQLSIVCVDDDGRVLDDGAAETRPWVGKRQDELPFSVTVIGGVDPLVALGLASDYQEACGGSSS